MTRTDVQMQKSLLLAGAALALSNLVPLAVPTAHAAPAAPAQTAVKHSTQVLTTVPRTLKLAALPAPAADPTALAPAESQFITLINARPAARTPWSWTRCWSPRPAPTPGRCAT
jgi:hypothetical protein